MPTLPGLHPMPLQRLDPRSGTTMAYAVLALTIVFESMGAILLRHARDSHPSYYLAAYLMYAISLFAFPITLDYIPLCVAYSIWAAVGCAITMLCGSLLFGEALTVHRVGGGLLIVSGVAMMAY